jgi:hypothetical protein
MQKLARREVLRGGGVAALALGAVALPLSSPRSATTEFEDPLADGVRRYIAEIAALNASQGLSDEELDEGIDLADAILGEALQHPVVTALGAIPMLDLAVEDSSLFNHTRFPEQSQPPRTYRRACPARLPEPPAWPPRSARSRAGGARTRCGGETIGLRSSNALIV